jgi:flagellar motor switch protein FliM
MERVLNQEEIDAMVRKARGVQSNAPQAVEKRSIVPCTFRQSGQLEGGQVRAITVLHEGFSRKLAQSMGAYLNVPFEAKLVSVEQLVYSEFLDRVPESTYMISIDATPMDAAAALQVDHSLVLPLIDILLGGNGRCEAMTREISEIEDRILEEVAKLICKELASSWAALGAKLELGKRQAGDQMQRFLPTTEKILCVSFEISFAEIHGVLNLVLPAAVSNPLLRKLAAEASSAGARLSKRADQKLKERMMDYAYPVVLGLTSIRLPVRSFMKLTPGTVYNLGLPVRKPAAFVIAGREAFYANPVRSGSKLAAQIGGLVVVSEKERKR